MDIVPILSTLKRHRTAAILIVFEIALTFAIVCNAIFLIRARLERIDRPTGIAEAEILRVKVTGIATTADPYATTAQDLAALRSIPGVRAAEAVNMVPLGGSAWNNSMSTVADDPNPPANVATYFGGPDLLETLGVRLIAGRDFTSDEYARFADVLQAERAAISAVIVTRGLAETLFPGQNALGQKIYAYSNTPQVIVGIVEHLARPNEISTGRNNRRHATLFPVIVPFTIGGTYVLRVDPSRAAEVLAAVDHALDSVDPNRIILDRQTFGEIRDRYYKQDRSMAWLLVGVALALLVVTALGVVGLASFWVQQRTRQIGIRRALGATRGDIVRYFLVENFLLATVGIVLGIALAFAINLWLMDKYQVERLPTSFLPIGAFLLWLLGQVAVLGPALRASTIAPAIATRSV